jgi:ribosomal protein S18 acetylase RimI-like enzyme
MIQIEPYQPEHRRYIEHFVAAIQETERALVPQLRPAADIAAQYAEWLLRMTAQRDGTMVMACDGDEPIGFACAWVDEDDDMLLDARFRRHARVSDVFVAEPWRRRGIGRLLLGAIEVDMRRRGCRQMRIMAKASNLAAMRCYEATGFCPYEVTLWKAIE